MVKKADRDQKIRRLGLRPTLLLDIGAHYGESVARFRRIWPNVAVYCFEPNPYAVQVLRQKYPESRSSHAVRVFETALGERRGSEVLHVTEEDGTSSLLPPHADLGQKVIDDVKVAVSELDDMLYPVTEMLCPYFIKVDVQGYEASVVRGGEMVFSEACGALIEICETPHYEGQSNFDEVHGLMESLGFVYQGTTRKVLLGSSLKWADHLWMPNEDQRSN